MKAILQEFNLSKELIKLGIVKNRSEAMRIAKQNGLKLISAENDEIIIRKGKRKFIKFVFPCEDNKYDRFVKIII